MIGESPRAEDLFPGAAGLFRRGRGEYLDDDGGVLAGHPEAVRWIAGVAVVGVVVLVGRAVVGWMNRNL